MFCADYANYRSLQSKHKEKPIKCCTKASLYQMDYKEERHKQLVGNKYAPDSFQVPTLYVTINLFPFLSKQETGKENKHLHANIKEL